MRAAGHPPKGGTRATTNRVLWRYILGLTPLVVHAPKSQCPIWPLLHISTFSKHVRTCARDHVFSLKSRAPYLSDLSISILVLEIDFRQRQWSSLLTNKQLTCLEARNPNLDRKNVVSGGGLWCSWTRTRRR